MDIPRKQWERIDARRHGRFVLRRDIDVRREEETIPYRVQAQRDATRDTLRLPELWQLQLAMRPDAPLWDRDAVLEDIACRGRTVSEEWRVIIEDLRRRDTRAFVYDLLLRTNSPQPATVESVRSEINAVTQMVKQAIELLREGMHPEDIIEYLDAFDAEAAQSLVDGYVEEIKPLLLAAGCHEELFEKGIRRMKDEARCDNIILLSDEEDDEGEDGSGTVFRRAL